MEQYSFILNLLSVLSILCITCYFIMKTLLSPNKMIYRSFLVTGITSLTILMYIANGLLAALATLLFFLLLPVLVFYTAGALMFILKKRVEKKHGPFDIDKNSISDIYRYYLS